MNDRYSRHERFAPIGKTGQEKRRGSHVLIVGAGALGSAIAEMLVRAGTGNITIVDRDYVEWSNLQRQQLYSEKDAEERLPKAVAAARRLAEINSEVQVNGLVMDVTAADIGDLLPGKDLILDATDNFDVRMLMNDAAQKYRIPWIYGACVGSYGITMNIIPGETPCLHCLMETIPAGGPTCDTAGIIAPAVQIVAAHQTAEALKFLVGDYQALRRKLLSFDLWNNLTAAIDVSGAKKDDCPSCGRRPSYPFLQAERQMKTAVLCGRDTVQIRPPAPMRRPLAEVEKMLAAQGKQVERNPYLVSFNDGPHRIVLFADGRALVHGTKETAVARSLYHRYFG